MQILIKRCLGVCVLMIMSASSIAAPVTIATGEYPPFTSLDARNGGFVSHIITEAFKRTGHEVGFTYLPWKRAKHAAQKGEYNATSYWQCTDAIKVDFYCSVILQQSPLVFFHRKSFDMPDWKKLEDLKGIKIGATSGYIYTDEFWRLAEQGVLDVEAVPEDRLNIGKLLKGRIDLFLVEPVLLYELLRKNFAPYMANLVEYHPKSLIVIKTHLLFSRKVPGNDILVEKFNQGLEDMKADGEYERLFDNLLQGYYSSSKQ